MAHVRSTAPNAALRQVLERRGNSPSNGGDGLLEVAAAAEREGQGFGAAARWRLPPGPPTKPAAAGHIAARFAGRQPACAPGPESYCPRMAPALLPRRRSRPGPAPG